VQPERKLNAAFSNGSAALSYRGPIVISLQHLTKFYDTPAGTCKALEDVTLEVVAGEFVAVSGKSGSGKSTLLNMVGGIDRPSSGSVVIDGVALRTMREGDLARWRGRSIGFVFQFFQLLPTLTAAENVMLPMDFHGVIQANQRRKRALELLDIVGIADQAQKLPSTLSGGQQQRVAIARAIANDPPVILADEPTGNLDSQSGSAILHVFANLAAAGKTVVIVTHERGLSGLVGRRIELADGMVASQ
jgi:putative ABC transport system ATP-binding protein